MNREQVSRDDTLENLRAKVPETYTLRFNDLVKLTDVFCDTYLNTEYKDLCREMAVVICQKGSPTLKGKAESWASGIVYAIGRVNFLSDPSQVPHMKSPDVAKGFGVSVGTMQAKMKIIWDELDLMQFHPDWCLPGNLENNPLVWMLEVNGFLIDI